MITTNQSKQKFTFEQFLAQNINEEGRYELVDGEIVSILATRQHEDIADFILRRFDREIERLNLNYRVSDRIIIRTSAQSGKEQGRQPDVSVVDKTVWESNRTAYSALLEPLQLAVEVVSTNWEDDYIDKLDEYQRLGIPEYWIVDYLAIGSRTFLGNPKEAALFVFLLNESGEYQYTRFKGTEQIMSKTFPELDLNVEQILAA